MSITTAPVTSGSALRDAIRNAQDRDSEEYHVPEWGVTLTLSAPDANTRAVLVEAAQALSDQTGAEAVREMYPAMIFAVVVDPDSGEPLFTEADRTWLATKNGAVVERVALECMRVAGLNPEAVDEGKDDSSPTPSGDTTTS